jgi:RNA polymerase sigma-70 factor (ECF subfamily)
MLSGNGPSWERGPGEVNAAGAKRAGPDYSLLNDESLVGRLTQQDVRALDTLYGRYSRPVFSLALKILGDREIVEEVVQEVFLRLWTRAASFDPQRGKLLSWLLTITHHRAVDELRRRRAQPEVDGLDEQLASAEEPASDPSETYSHVEDKEAVQRALARLPEAQRRPIEMAYYGGLTQVEIAQTLKQPLGTIKTRMRLGMQKLRTLLAEHEDARLGSVGSRGTEPA